MIAAANEHCQIHAHGPPLRSLMFRLAENLAIRLPGSIIRSHGVGFLAVPRAPLLPLPAGVNRVQAPLGTALAGAERLAVDFDEHGIGVRAGENANRHPARNLGLIAELQLANLAVSVDLAGFDRLAVDDQLDRYAARVSD